MQEQLAEIVVQFEAAAARLEALVRATPESRWAVRRDLGRWSVAECVAHLNLTSLAYVPLLRDAFERYPRTSKALRYRRDPIGWLLGAVVGPMPRIGSVRFGRVRTSAAFVPSGNLDREQTLAEFHRLQDEQISLVKDAEGRPLNDIRIASPFNARVKYNAYACLMLLAPHQMRHIEQAEQVWSDARKVA